MLMLVQTLTLMSGTVPWMDVKKKEGMDLFLM